MDGPRRRGAYGFWCSNLLSNAPKPRFGSPFSRGRLLMGPNDGRVDHEVLVARVGRQNLENLFPNARLGPASKALVGAFPVAVALGKMAPVGPAAQNPQTAVDESPVIRGGPAPVSRFAGQQILDLLPLSFLQFVSLDHIRLTRLLIHK